MRNPGRCDGDDARPDRDDELAAQAESQIDGPADGDGATAGTPDDPDAAPQSSTPHTGTPDTGTSPTPEAPPGPAAEDAPATPTVEPGDSPAGPPGPADAHPDDDLLFDPLLSDEPIDLAAVRADDALLDALAVGDASAAGDLVDADDPLIAMLAAWAASARPDGARTPEFPARETRPARPALTVVGADDPAPRGPDTAGPDTAGTAATGTAPARPVAITSASLDPVTLPGLTRHLDVAPLPSGAAAFDAVTEPALEPARARGVDDGTTGDAPDDPPATVLPWRAALDRARPGRRRTAPGTRPASPHHPLHRAAVAVVVAVLAVSAAAAAGGTAQPGEAGFTMTRVFFSERARSLQAAEVVAAGLDRARAYLEGHRPDLAAQELAVVDAALPDVRDEEGRTTLHDQQQALESAVALAPPYVPDPAAPKPAPRDRDPDASILAEGVTPPESSGATGPEGSTDRQAGPDGDGAGGSVGSDPRASAAVDAPSSTAAVGGVSDEGVASTEPATGTATETSTSPTAPTSGPGTTDPADPTATSTGTVTSTSPTETSTSTAPDTATSSSTAPADPDPDDVDSDPADSGSGSVAAVPAAAGAAVAVRPAAHRWSGSDPARAGHAHGAVTVQPDDPAPHDPAPDVAAARPAAPATTPVRVVVTTVPAPVDPAPHRQP